jgi:acetyl esterase/lipase
LQAAYFEYLYALAQTLSTPEISVSIVVLSYSLAPEHLYPTQLIQAATLLKHLLEDLKLKPSSLILMGDSAGGNLVLSVLSHILHPHPYILYPNKEPSVPRIELSEPLRAAVLISPWVSFATDQPSYKRNAESDMLMGTSLKEWSDHFIGKGNIHDTYSEPIRGGSNWWTEASGSVSNVLIWGGGNEILIDSIEHFAVDFEKGWKSGGGREGGVSTIISPKAAHVEPLVEVMLQIKPKSEGALSIENWLKSKV